MRIEHRRGRRPDLLLLLWVGVTLGVVFSTGTPAVEAASTTASFSLHILPPAPLAVLPSGPPAAQVRGQSFGLWLTLHW
jgi:hypothetical protein